MDTASNRGTVNGDESARRTAVQVLQEQQLQQQRIQSFLDDNNGPKTMLSHAYTSANESTVNHRAVAARKIDDIVSKLKG
ncbi:hypothetical protein SGCOL_002258 [Colletotrichum sp. CLE4]